MIINDFFNWIKGLMAGNGSVTVTGDEVSAFLDSKKGEEAALYLFALNAGTNVLANALSKCEVRTFERGKEVRGDEYYRWNYEPNPNQNASQFFQSVVWNLVFKGECLVVEGGGGSLLVADTYHREEGPVGGRDYFDGVSVSTGGVSQPLDGKFRMDRVLFYRLNNRNLRGLLASIMQDYSEILEAARENTIRTYGEHGILSIDAQATTANYGKKADGTPRTFNDVYREMMEKQFKDYFKSPNSVMPLFAGFKYENVAKQGSRKSTSEFKDYEDAADGIFERVANALQIPPSLLKGDVADVTHLTRNMITFAIDPIARMMEEENNRKLYGKAVLEGTGQRLDTSRIMHNEPLEVAQSVFNLIGAGWSIDEVRRLTGEAELNTEWSRKHYLSLNFRQYDSMEENGDEDDGENEEHGGGSDDGSGDQGMAGLRPPVLPDGIRRGKDA